MACASSSMSTVVFDLPRTRRSSPIQTPRVWPFRFRRSAGQTGFFTKLGRLIKEKAKSVVDKLFSGFSKTRDNLAVIDELLLYWNLFDTDRVHDELEEGTKVLGAEAQSQPQPQPQPSARRQLYPCMVGMQNSMEKQ
ncbi:hypothetical protein CsSME_00024009 [Camellia sinensis var. sinensis]